MTDADLGVSLACGSCGESFVYGAEIVADRKRTERERLQRERAKRKAAEAEAKRPTPEQIAARHKRHVHTFYTVMTIAIVAACVVGGSKIYTARAEARRAAEKAAADAKREAEQAAAKAERERIASEFTEKLKAEREAKRRDYVGLAEPMLDELRKSLSFVSVGVTLDDYRRRVQETTAAWNNFNAKTSDRYPSSKANMQSCVEAFEEALTNWEKKIRAIRYRLGRGESESSEYTRELDAAMQKNWADAGDHFKAASKALNEGN